MFALATLFASSAKSTFSATRKIRTSRTSGMPSEMIVRGCRSRAPERDLAAVVVVAAVAAPSAAGRGVRVDPAPRASGLVDGITGVASASGTGGSLMSWHPCLRTGCR